MPITRKSLTSGVVFAAVVALGAGAAVAYWTSTGDGTGTGTTGSSTAFTVASSAATGGPLTPGGPTQTIAFTVTNPSTGHQNLSAVAVTVAGAGGAAWTAVAGCSAADYTVGTPSITYGDLGPGAVASGTVTLTMNNLPSSQDGCEGATVPLYIAAS
ncbi:MAG: hypothetical protein ACT4P1_01685 [Sporichthyaceae bacterium]